MTSHYDSGYYNDKIRMPEAAYAILSRARARKMQPYIRPSDRVFEFGVGSGINLASLICAARDGFEINRAAHAVAREHGVTLVESLDGIDGIYDVVICHHVLEHLTSPAECLANLRRLLRAGGTLLLFVPYDGNRRHYLKHIPTDADYHLYSWTPHTLGNLVIESGFDLQSATLGMFAYDRISARMASALHIGDVGFGIVRRCAQLLRREREICVIAKRPDPRK